MPSLGERQKRRLLEIARAAIVAAVEGKPRPEIPAEDEDLQRPGGAFVTLHRASRLRGCIGQVPGQDPLIEVVAHCAALAALEDPRFHPVAPEEVATLEVEISVLSTPQDILPQAIIAGTHGLIVSQGHSRGLLLPQVATQFVWSSLRFLEETCVKASLAPHAWRDPNTRIQAFTAEVFSEAEFDTSAAPKERYSIST